jgi:hypothetical protein
MARKTVGQLLAMQPRRSTGCQWHGRELPTGLERVREQRRVRDTGPVLLSQGMRFGASACGAGLNQRAFACRRSTPDPCLSRSRICHMPPDFPNLVVPVAATLAGVFRSTGKSAPGGLRCRQPGAAGRLRPWGCGGQFQRGNSAELSNGLAHCTSSEAPGANSLKSSLRTCYEIASNSATLRRSRGVNKLYVNGAK